MDDVYVCKSLCVHTCNIATISCMEKCAYFSEAHSAQSFMNIDIVPVEIRQW